jgi:hypothetical protein
MKTQEQNTIKIENLQEKLKEVIKFGYGETIELKINGEYYTILK